MPIRFLLLVALLLVSGCDRGGGAEDIPFTTVLQTNGDFGDYDIVGDFVTRVVISEAEEQELIATEFVYEGSAFPEVDYASEWLVAVFFAPREDPTAMASVTAITREEGPFGDDIFVDVTVSGDPQEGDAARPVVMVTVSPLTADGSPPVVLTRLVDP